MLERRPSSRCLPVLAALALLAADAGPEACVISAHDARTGEEVWRTRMIPAPGEPGDEQWGFHHELCND